MKPNVLQVDMVDSVATVTLDRPERKNALNSVLWDQLLDTLRRLGRDSNVRVVVLTGAGGNFSSGGDLSDSSAADDGEHVLTTMRHVNDAAIALHRLPQPTIAKVRGAAVGAGMNLALGCDLVVASVDARFCEIFTRRGISVDFGGTWLLPRQVGLHRAKELALLADFIDAAEADRLGIVNRVVQDEELDHFVDGWARRLADGPPLAMAMTKRMLNQSAHVTFEQALDDEALAQSVNAGTEDTVEAMTAFLEKRTPRFLGR